MNKNSDESDDPPISITQTMTDSPGSLQIARDLIVNTKVPYSRTQTIEVSSSPGPYNETLNLDNVATMVQFGEWSLEQVAMELIESPPLLVDRPKAGERYMADQGGNAIVFNPDSVPGMEFRQATIGMGGKRYLFNRFISPSHLIQIGERRFKVTLQSIRDKSSTKQKLIAYTFGISEE